MNQYAKGENNGRAKYKIEQVLEIATSDLSPKMLAWKLKVNLKSVYDIRQGRAWNQITGIKKKRA